MTAAWVAGTTRARALVRRRIGAAGARLIATAASGEGAIAALAATPYGHDVRPGMSLSQAQHAIMATVLWHMRVLAGWLPREGTDQIRLLARWFEIANVDERLSGGTTEFQLGGLAGTWPRLRGPSAPSDIRAALATTAWGDPGGDRPRQIQLGMRLAWAAQVADRIDQLAPLAAGAAALLVARELLLDPDGLTAAAQRRAHRLLGDTLPRLGAPWPATAATRWVLAGIDRPDDLWRGEVRWWDRLERDGFALLSDSRFGPPAALGAVAVLAADAHQALAALELAVRGQGGDHVLA